MKIVYINGFKIRQTLDTDFTLCHSRSTDCTNYAPKFYIPEGELWFDAHFKDEEKFVLEVETYEFENIEELKKKNKDSSFVDKQRWFRIEKFVKKEPLPNFVEKEEQKDELTIKYINGSVVRQYLDPEFVFGGHDLVYSYIPKNEIWIDNKMEPKELPHILIHEAIERKLMAEGKLYDTAHEYANTYERDSRRAAGGIYPGDPSYPSEWTKESVIQNYYVAGNE